MGKAAALQRAQQEVREQEQYAAPYYWAGFVLAGDTGDVPVGLPWPWIGGGAVSLAVLGAGAGAWLIWRKRRAVVVPPGVRMPAETATSSVGQRGIEEQGELLAALLASAPPDKQE